MRNYCIFILLFLSSFILKAQKACDEGRIVALHPTIGQTITIDEKKKFSLLSQYADSTFESAQLVKYNDSTYSFVIRKTDGERSEKFITKIEVEKMYAQIEQIKPASTIPQPVIKKEPEKVNEELVLLENEKENDKWAHASKNPPPRGSTPRSKNTSPAADFACLLIQAAVGLLK